MTAQPGLHYGTAQPGLHYAQAPDRGFALMPGGSGQASPYGAPGFALRPCGACSSSSPYGAWGTASPAMHYGGYGVNLAITLRQRITHLEVKLAKLRTRQKRYFRQRRAVKIAELRAKLASLKQRLKAKEKRQRQRRAGRDEPLLDNAFLDDLASLEGEFASEDLVIDDYNVEPEAQGGGSAILPIILIGLGGVALVGAIAYVRKRKRK